jgi:integrase
MTNELATAGGMTAIQAAGQVANQYAAASAFADYVGRKSDNTLEAQRADLATFAAYLCDATGGADCPAAEQLQTAPAAWHGVTHGLVAGFVQWMLRNEYAIASVNRKLSTVRVYAKLAAQAKVIDSTEATLIRGVAGYGGTEGKRQDEKRKGAGQATRNGRKKAQHVSLAADQVKALKTQPDTPQGRRDAIIMALLLDHGLRVGELALLEVTAFDLKAGTFTFYRPKVDKVQTHRMTPDTLRAVAAWLHTDAPAMGPLLRGSRKGGALTEPGMSERAITARVAELGAGLGVVGLSAHDCRHSWATRASKGKDAFALRDAGGWNSLAMPSRYVEAATIANERIALED